MRSFDRRLTKLEMANIQPYADVLKLIDQNRYYDELDEAQKNRYCEYVRVPRQIFEETHILACGDFHTLLKRIDPPTPEELSQIIQDVQDYVNLGKPL